MSGGSLFIYGYTTLGGAGGGGGGCFTFGGLGGGGGGMAGASPYLSVNAFFPASLDRSYFSCVLSFFVTMATVFCHLIALTDGLRVKNGSVSFTITGGVNFVTSTLGGSGGGGGGGSFFCALTASEVVSSRLSIPNVFFIMHFSV